MLASERAEATAIGAVHSRCDFWVLGTEMLYPRIRNRSRAKTRRILLRDVRGTVWALPVRTGRSASRDPRTFPLPHID